MDLSAFTRRHLSTNALKDTWEDFLVRERSAQALRTTAAIAEAQHLSTRILFIDLATAFHQLVRECALGVAIAKDVEAVLPTL